MRSVTALILSTASAAIFSAHAEDITSRMPPIEHGQMVNGAACSTIATGDPRRLINRVTVNGPGNSTIRVLTPSNIEDHRTTTPIYGVQVTG